MHGFEITQWLETRSGGTLGVRDSALYQALHRIEERGLVIAKWGVTANNQKARCYQLTEAGRKYFALETDQWVRYANTVAGMRVHERDVFPNTTVQRLPGGKPRSAN